MKLDIQMFSTPYVPFENAPSTNTPIDATNLNKIQTDCRDEIGSLSLLETTNKTDLVSAINENKRNIDEGGGGGGIVALKSITTEPSTFDTGDKYYDETDDLIYTATSSSTWNEGEEPKVTSLYLNEADNHLYRYYDDQMNIEAGGETLPVGSEIDFDGVNVPTGWEQVDDVPVYSTTETICGTWIDGKPIYRKVIDMGALPNATAKDVQHNISNIDNIVHIYGWAYRSSDNFRIPLPFTSPDVSANALLGVLGNYVRITTGTDRSSFAVSYAILEYTKTTN